MFEPGVRFGSMANFDKDFWLKKADEADRIDEEEEGIRPGPGKGYFPNNGKNCGQSPGSKAANSLPFAGDPASRRLDGQTRIRHKMARASERYIGQRREA